MSEPRLELEYERLRSLAAASNGVVAVEATPNRRHFNLTLRVPAPVGHDRNYTVQREHQLTIDLPDRYPQARPIVRFSDPILVPNIWPDGSPCILETWVPARRLDDLVCELIEEMQGIEPNYESIANEAAGDLFMDADFQRELRERLGPPVRLSSPARAASASQEVPTSGIRTVSQRTEAPATIRTVAAGQARSSRPSITTVRER